MSSHLTHGEHLTDISPLWILHGTVELTRDDGKKMTITREFRVGARSSEEACQMVESFGITVWTIAGEMVGRIAYRHPYGECAHHGEITNFDMD